MTRPAILPVAYLAPLPHYTAMLTHPENFWDVYEHFHKQYFYNRCTIYGANGALKLIVPLCKRHEKTPLKDVRISYDSNWQTLHWRSLEASYRRSPYFEYYEHKLAPLYDSFKPGFLLDWNVNIFETVNRLIDTNIKLSFTTEYKKVHEGADDYRNLAAPQTVAQQNAGNIKYIQVFEEKYGFIPHLSIIDLLFCEGPHSKQVLLS